MLKLYIILFTSFNYSLLFADTIEHTSLEVTKVNFYSLFIKKNANSKELKQSIKSYYKSKKVISIDMEGTAFLTYDFFKDLGVNSDVERIVFTNVEKGKLSQALEFFPNVKSVELWECNLLDQALPILRRCKSLDIDGQVNNLTLQSIWQYKRIESITLSFQGTVTINDLKGAKNCQFLKFIDVEGNVSKELMSQIKKDKILNPLFVFHEVEK